MKSIFPTPIILIIGILTSSPWSIVNAQCLQKKVSFEYVVNESDLIVEATITGKSSIWNDTRDQVHTVYDLSIFSILKGSFEGQNIKVVARGGQIDDFIHICHPEISLELDQMGVFLLRPLDQNKFTPVQNSFVAWAVDQSTYIYDFNVQKAIGGFREFDFQKNTIKDAILKITGDKEHIIQEFDVHRWIDRKNKTNSRQMMMVNFSPSTVNAGVDDVLTITGSGFGSSPGTVWFRNADFTNPNVSSPAFSTLIDSWSNNEVVVRVPSFAGSGKVRVRHANGSEQTSSSDLNVNYSISSFPGDPSKFIRYVAETNDGIINYQFNIQLASNSEAVSSFERAMASWRCNQEINWQRAGDTNINSTGSDGVSVIRWANVGELVDPVVGQYNGYFFASLPNEFWCAREFDIMFRREDSNLTWNYGPELPSAGETDFETVALHEIGHALLLGHVSDNTEIMYPVSSSTLRTPTPKAVDGASFSQPFHLSSTVGSCASHYPMTLFDGFTISSTNADDFANAIIYSCNEDVLTFDPSLNGSTITIPGEAIEILQNMTIQGLGINSLTLSGNNLDRIFTIMPDVHFTLQDIKLENGSAATNGGAFYNQGTTTLHNVLLENNKENGLQKAFSSDPNLPVIFSGSSEIKE